MADPLDLCEEGQLKQTCHQGAASVSGKPSFKMDTAYSCTNLRLHIKKTDFFAGSVITRYHKLVKVCENHMFSCCQMENK